MVNDTVMPFDQLREIYNLPQSHFFRYLQVRSFITNTAKLHPNRFSFSTIEKILQSANSKKLISKFYRALLSQSTEHTASMKSLWVADFGVAISMDEWIRAHQLIRLLVH